MRLTAQLIALLFVLRFINAFLVTTYLFPDEWWQFGEPAHFFIYKFGYLTWDWRAGIRSYVTILPLITLLKITQYFKIGEDWMVTNGSKLIMAAFLTLTDVYTFKLAGKIFGPSCKSYALLLSLTSAFHFSRSIRSLSNNIEMALSTVALYYIPSKLSKGNYKLSLVIIGITCLIRITSVMFWITPLILCLNRLSMKDRFVSTPLIILATILAGLLIDSYFYGNITITWWNFFKWNILKRVSNYYGNEPFSYHFTATMPLMLNTHIGYFLLGIWRGWKRSILIVLIAFFLLNSLQSHKESRFLAPIYPIIILYCSHGLQQFNVSLSKKSRFIRNFSSVIHLGIIFSQIFIGWFYGRVHFNGSYEIVDRLRKLVDSNPNDSSIFFLTPCHVIPFQGYLHRENVKAEFLKCHPKVVDDVILAQESISRDFYANDLSGFLKGHVIDQKYTYIVLFEGDSHKYSDQLKIQGYKECDRVNNSGLLLIGSNRSRGDLLVYCNLVQSQEAEV